MVNSPQLEGRIKYLGKMYAKDAWGNDDAEKAIKWLETRLKEEMDKNLHLELNEFASGAKIGTYYGYIFGLFTALIIITFISNYL